VNDKVPTWVIWSLLALVIGTLLAFDLWRWSLTR